MSLCSNAATVPGNGICRRRTRLRFHMLAAPFWAEPNLFECPLKSSIRNFYSFSRSSIQPLKSHSSDRKPYVNWFKPEYLLKNIKYENYETSWQFSCSLRWDPVSCAIFCPLSGRGKHFSQRNEMQRSINERKERTDWTVAWIITK